MEKYLDLADKLTQTALNALEQGNYARYKKAMRVMKRVINKAKSLSSL